MVRRFASAWQRSNKGVPFEENVKTILDFTGHCSSYLDSGSGEQSYRARKYSLWVRLDALGMAETGFKICLLA